MSSIILERLPLGFPWVTVDPFLFCAHHLDRYPKGNAALGPEASLAGRSLGQDFTVKDGFRMYHGVEVPGFPQHPHRGFETVTLVTSGYVDHSDSLGATARFGRGDAQWLTAGEGIVHAEMFPLLETDRDNPLELFQVWLNLPSRDKMAPPHFSMFWAETIPIVEQRDAAGRAARVRLVAGTLGDHAPPPPPPRSWAAASDHDVAIWHVALEAGATATLPPAKSADSVRTLYFYEGDELSVSGERSTTHEAMVVRPDREVVLVAGASPCALLVLQGVPIGEPVAQHGPFVMNRREELLAAFRDYERTRFGGWPWPSDAPVHPRGEGRFAVHADGKRESRGS